MPSVHYPAWLTLKQRKHLWFKDESNKRVSYEIKTERGAQAQSWVA